MTYAESVSQVNGPDAYELWWLPVDQPDAREVLFGVGEGAGEYWDNRWDRARKTTEWLYAEWLDESRPAGETCAHPQDGATGGADGSN